ncbi:MAG: hypothetical protein K2P50_15295, partial [Lachnospiraceae bacterium]|nr:hypothetical protein [Lachnospiraceae bacterium]
ETKGIPEDKAAPVAGGFRIRLVIAMELLLTFIICDMKQISYEGESTTTVFERIAEDTDLTGVLDEVGLK